jgi:putative membrane protein
MPIGQHYGWMVDMMGWGGWMTPRGWILIIILVVILVYALPSLGGLRPLEFSKGLCMEEKQDLETPLDILKRRYARGEISREDFERMKNDLTNRKGT